VLIDDLIARHGLGAIVSIDAHHMGDDYWRYVVTINGQLRSDLDVRTVDPPGTPAITIVDEQGRELVAWATPMKHPNRVLRRLRELPDSPAGA
jgi:hypothetical protein